MSWYLSVASWEPRRDSSACSRCSRRRATGRVRSSPTGSRSAPRTIRNDIDRLRALGYPVHATRGSIGGYRLEAGATLPPLLLDDEEAVAVAIGLRTATGGAVTGIEETSLRALAKLEQVLPPRLRSRVNTLQTVHAARPPPGGTDRRPSGPDRARRGLPRPPRASIRLRRPARRAHPAARRAVPPRQLGPALVPGRLGHRPGRLADVPRRPDAARHVARRRGSRPGR